METKKVAVACFVGGALCSAVALMVSPVYWWLGLIAGLAGGYISYEFREVLRAIPVAFRAARKDSVTCWRGAIEDARAWLSRPHPFLYLGVLLTLPLAILFFPESKLTRVDGDGWELIFYLYATGALFTGAPFYILAFIGARVVERRYWRPFFGGDSDHMLDRELHKLKSGGYSEAPLTYTNAARWMAKGFLEIFPKFFVLTLWKYLAIGLWTGLSFLGRFAWHLFRLVHSKKRVLCALDGTIGGAASYIWLASAATSPGEQVMLVVFGGLIGAALGVANWEIVSIRILHVTEDTS